MGDIYGRSGSQFNGAFAADAARIVFGGGGGTGGLDAGVGLLTQQVNIGYTQQVSRLYEVGTNFTYLIAGRTQGQASLGRVLGPRPIQVAFYSAYGNVCNAGRNVLNFQCDTGCPSGDQTRAGVIAPTGGLTGGAYAFTLANCVIVNIGMSVAAQDMIVNEQLQLMFIALNLGAV